MSVTSTALNVTVNYSVTYMFSVSAINCAGTSEAAILSDIQLGMTEINDRSNSKFVSSFLYQA